MTGYDDFQVIPHQVGDVVGGSVERPLGSRLSNYQALFKGQRKSQDYTLTTFDDRYDGFRNPQKGYIEHGWDVNDAYLSHGMDWSLFEYNPYGHTKDADWKNPRVRRFSGDWAKIVGFGPSDSSEIGFETGDVIGGNIHHSIVQYRNYPEEGYSSYGKKSSGAAGDKRWAWKGNTWVPAA